MSYDVAKLLAMTQAQLDDLFRASPPGDIPDGTAEGTAIIAPGTQYSETIAKVINHFGWQGKVFDAAKGVLKNSISIFRVEAIVDEEAAKYEAWRRGFEASPIVALPFPG